MTAAKCTFILSGHGFNSAAMHDPYLETLFITAVVHGCPWVFWQARNILGVKTAEMTTEYTACIMQVSNDVRMVLPLLVAIIIAKWIADAVSHSLYHAILEVKCVPILHSSPQSRVSLDLIPVHHVMAYPVVILQEQMPLTKVREVLRDTRHNGFPVVRNTPQGQVSSCA